MQGAFVSAGVDRYPAHAPSEGAPSGREARIVSKTFAEQTLAPSPPVTPLSVAAEAADL